MASNPEAEESTVNRDADGPVVVLSESAAAKMVAACVNVVFGASEKPDPDLPLLRQAFLDLNKLMYADGVSWQLVVPENTPSWIDEDLLIDTITTMSPRYGKPVLGRDSVALIENVGRLADVLEGGAL